MTCAASDSLADALQKIDKVLADTQLQAEPSKAAEVGPCLKHPFCSCVIRESAEELLCPSLDHPTCATGSGKGCSHDSRLPWRTQLALLCR